MRSSSTKFIAAINNTTKNMRLTDDERLQLYSHLAIEMCVRFYGKKGGMDYWLSAIWLRFPLFDPMPPFDTILASQLSKRNLEQFFQQFITNLNNTENF